MKRFVGFVLGRRGWVVAACLALTALSLWSVSHGVIASSMAKLFLGESPEYARYRERAEIFGTDEILVVGLEAPDVLSAATQARLAEAIDRIAARPDVERVDSILDLQHLEEAGGDLVVERYADQAAAEPERTAELLAAIRDDPLTGGLLLSRDGRQTALVVEFSASTSRTAESTPTTVAEILAVFRDAGFAAEQIHRAGFVATLAEVMVQTDYNIRALFPFVAGVLLLTVWLMFRRLWPVAITLTVALLSVTWTMGFAVLLDPQINVLMAVVPAVVMIVAFSDVVHLCSAYLLELESGLSKMEAIEASVADVGRACLYTSLTTFVGFVSLSLVPTPVFRVLGLILGFGVAVALLLAVTLTPILFSVMVAPKALRAGSSGVAQRILDEVLRVVRTAAIVHPWKVIAGFGVVGALAIAGITQIHVETRFSERLSPDNPVRRDLRWFSEHFAGTTVLDLYIDADGEEGLLDPDRLASVAAFQEAVSSLPGVDASFSLVDVLQQLDEILDPERGERVLPPSRQAIAQYLLLFEMAGGEGLDRLVSFDRSSMRIALRVDDEGFRAVNTIGLAALELADRTLEGGLRAEPGGHIYLLGGWLDEILAGQRDGLLLSLVVISLMMAFAVRSVRVGMLSMIPNVFPLVVLGGWVGGFWEHVDSDTVMMALMAIGIGVDDTIHFLVRYRLEHSRNADRETALARTFDFAGRAIVMTTVILVAGFLPFATTDYFSTRMMGTLLPLCLVVALLADLLLVPALARVGLMDWRDAVPDEPT